MKVEELIGILCKLDPDRDIIMTEEFAGYFYDYEPHVEEIGGQYKIVCGKEIEDYSEEEEK